MCPGCHNSHDESSKQFLIQHGEELFHIKCWDKETRNA